MNLEKLNQPDVDRARAELMRCCGSSAWVERMLSSRPFGDAAHVLELAEEIWFDLSEEDWREAFTHHPRIGDVESLRKKFASTATWAESEQKGTRSATPEVLERLAAGNSEYEKKFGYIYIVCATGKSAEEMLALCKDRLRNDAPVEISNAAEEQRRITHLRLQKILEQ